MPNTRWQKLILRDHIIGLMDRNIRKRQDKLCKHYELVYENRTSKIEQPEQIAIQIGGFAYDTFGEYFEPIFDDDIGSKEGKKLAKGYVGAKTMEKYDICED